MEVAIVIGAAIIAAAIVFGSWSIATSLQGLGQVFGQVFGHAFGTGERWVSYEELEPEHTPDDGGVTFRDHLPPWSNPSLAEIFAWHHRRLESTLESTLSKLPGPLVGHMHLDAPPGDPEWADSTWFKRHERPADGPWTWVIADPAGVVLRRVPAQPIEYEERLSRDRAMRAEAQRAASEVFPVCSVQAAKCGYGGLESWAYNVIL